MADRDPKGTVDPEDPEFAAKFTIPADAYEAYRYGEPAVLRRTDPQTGENGDSGSVAAH